MWPLADYLVMIAIMTTGEQPIPRAKIQCIGIVRQVDGPLQPQDESGAVLVTDSRGHMYFSVMAGDYPCRVTASRFKTWEGTLTIQGNESYEIVLERE
mgnify:CR=1 FL=1